MAVEYYAKLSEIMSDLTTQGFGAQAEAIRNAMSAGATSTEILMAARWHLEQIECLKIEGSTARKIGELIDTLRIVLS